MNELRIVKLSEMTMIKLGLRNDKLYFKDEVDNLIASKDRIIRDYEDDYKEACDLLATANLIKDEQKEKADKLLSCLKCLVMRDLIKDCPEKDSAIEIVKEYDLW